MILSGSHQQSMTSLEISELVNKRHDNVKRTVDNLVKQAVITSPQIEEKSTAGRPSTFFVFSGEQGKRDSIIVVAQLCPEFTARLVDRWQELEAQVAKPVTDPMQLFADPTLLRNALLNYSEKVIELETKVDEMQGTVNAHARLTKAEGSLCITDAAKALQVNPKRLFAVLSENRWIYKRVGSTHWLGYQDKVQTGYLEHKISELTRPDGSTKISEQVRITPKGLTKISQFLSH
ncbi:phage antirepressor KilAC domain-containing protein [Acinetobacter pollinis]|uniref:phage antirepressor KilAC domain-containing protein n=1 Tax=Acinetobacter pollinis TaxID=2605270 RepID=UPI0018C205FE|nr:phage antirepressor KilAC domain-containing protein [Acinetobacter pollinis]MBF7694176.1 phage antirepressor KilAC domain-containing protein [Acinetobacter pollinis]MBF7701749.1 phage antirepressor KilAC domain-containing protein [Acinetobacter pollinis]